MSMDKESIYSQLLVIRCRQGSQEAWEELVSRWEKPLLYYIRRMIDNEHLTIAGKNQSGASKKLSVGGQKNVHRKTQKR